jgi:nucleotide-binding universal stress UspA family protein
VETIANEAERGDYDLVVIGAPAPLGRYRVRARDYAAGIVSATRRPVLVVPMPE